MSTPKTQYAILGFLKTIGPSSGYQIKKIMAESTSHFWSEAFGSIYPALQKLVQQDLVVRSGVKGTGKRESIIYTITQRGINTLNGWLKVDPEAQKPRSELLLKLFFSNGQPSAQIICQLERHRKKVEERLAVFQLIKSRLLKEEADNPSLSYWLMTLSHGIIHAHASIEWCNECLKTLNKEKNHDN